MPRKSSMPSLPIAALLTAALLTAGLLAGCDYTRVDVATQGPTAACEDAAGVISARTFACGASHDEANARYDAFFEAYRCIEWDPVVTPYEEMWHCSYAIGQLECDAVQAYGDDLDAWMAESPACPLLVERRDGTPLPGGIVTGEGSP